MNRKCGNVAILCFSLIKLVKTTNNISYDIIGGEYATINDFSYSVYVNVIYTEDGIEFVSRCGASVLNQFLMLTAAHCLDARDIFMAEIRTGNAENDAGRLLRVDAYTKHHDYRRQPVRNDIAVFRLYKELIFGETVKRVVLLREPPSEAVDLAGWGLISDDAEKDNRLKWVRQRLMRHKACVDAIGSIYEGMFCAKHPSGYTGAGDSGSALVVRRFIQIGIVSFSRVQDKRITVYVNTSHYFTWIQKATRRLGCPKDRKILKPVEMSTENADISVDIDDSDT